MICIIAGNFTEAKRYAISQNLDTDEWFFPVDEQHLSRMSNFHVLVVGTAGENVPVSYFNRIYSLALKRGRIGRV